MSSPPTAHAPDRELAAARRSLAWARRRYYEEPGRALAEAARCHELGRLHGDQSIAARARAMQGAVSLHRGDLQGAIELALEAERSATEELDVDAQVEVAALRAEVSFFTGAYTDALREAERALALADGSGEGELRIFARRATCLVFGNVGVPDWKERLDDLLALALAAGDRWEIAISYNDVACYLQEAGELAGAEREIERGLDALRGAETESSFALAVLHSTRADIRLLAGRARDALEDATRSIRLMVEGGEPNPYVLGVTVRAEVQARMALGELDGARESGEDALTWLGDRVPQTRSLILNTMATTLREAGRVEEAYDALARASELERQAFRELSELQLGLERAALETRAARRRNDELAAKNRQLAEAHAELGRRAAQLETLQDQLREQAERDWLTGLHNRRFLARELDRLTRQPSRGLLSVAVMDIDLFKSINDRFGHAIGDEVLIRFAGVLCDVLRSTDVVVRSGGEEFLVLMPATDAGAARAACERIRVAVADADWERTAVGLAVTTSVGVAAAHDPADLEALVQLADARLYEAKSSGRNCVVA